MTFCTQVWLWVAKKSCIGIGKATWKLLPDHGNKGQMFSISPRFEAGNSCMKISSGICSSPWSIVSWWTDGCAFQMWNCTKEFVHILWRQSTGFARGSSKCHTAMAWHCTSVAVGKLGWGNLARSKLTLKNWPAYIVAPAFLFLYSVRFYIGHGGAQWLDRHILSSC
jgi:hypothetical protein